MLSGYLLQITNRLEHKCIMFKRQKNNAITILFVLITVSCSEEKHEPAGELSLVSKKIENVDLTADPELLSGNSPGIKLKFSQKIDPNSLEQAISCTNTETNGEIELNMSLSDGDSCIVINPKNPLDSYLTVYNITILRNLKSGTGVYLNEKIEFNMRTGIDPSDKFSRVSDDELLDIIQKTTFNFFWTDGSPDCGLALDASERPLTDCTTGGSGFGIMFIPAAIERGFITRQEGLDRMVQIISFLKNKAVRFHGAFPHRINGATGEVTLWQGADDDGADLLETSFLMMGLLTVRQYFDSNSEVETTLRNDITGLYENVEWSWFTRGEDALYWLWSPTVDWKATFMCKGWNETLITYVLAASSPTYPVKKTAYDNGWATNGAIKNGKTFYGYTLPFGPDYGGWPGYSQYSFLGINPYGLKDQYGDFELQLKNVHLINHAYCVENKKGYYNYNADCWGYTGTPSADKGLIQPYAAVGALPYTPEESMSAIRYFYYVLGDKIFQDNGFSGDFNLQTTPISVGKQVFAYDQLNYIVAIENYRSGLIWDLFTSCPEVKAGMRKLGFTAPYL